jgi:hypothetical protein
MGNYPVLKAREVAALLEKFGFVEVQGEVLTSNIAIPTDAAQQFLFTRDGTSRQFSCGRLPKILALLLMNSSRTDDRIK